MRLFEKCTMAVIAIAMSIGKKRAKTGISKVPSPNPEKSVSPAPISVTMPVQKISILNFLQ
jgi:hypothetical protein